MTDTPLVNWAPLLMLRELQQPGEPDPVADVVSTFLEDSAERIAILQQAALRGDAAEVILQAHSLKGAAGLIGAEPLRAAASEVELMAKASGVAGLAPVLERLATLMAGTHTHLAAGPGSA